MPDNQQVTQDAGMVGTATLLSRIFGYARDMSIAAIFGAGPVSDAFIAAFRIPNMVRRLFGEGTLSMSVVPVVSTYLHTEGRQAVSRIALSGIRLLSVVLAAVAVAGVLASPWMTSVVAHGFKADPAKFALTVDLTRVMFPYVALIGAVAFFMGILNAMGHFTAPALAPVLLNLAMIGALWLVTLVTPDPSVRAVGLGFGVLVGGVLQLALQIPFLMKTGVSLRRKTPWFHPALIKIGKLFIPATLGAAVLQINTIVINLLASFQSDGSVTFLYFADRLVQFPLGIFGIAVATVVLPVCSRQAAAADMNAFKETLTFGLRLVLFLTLPSMVGLVVLRVPIVELLFQHGAFDSDATRLTAHALLYYTVGLWAFAGVRILVAAFYALQDTTTPVVIATISIIANAALGWILMRTMNHAGLALAVSLSSILNLAILMATLQRRIGVIDWPSLVPFLLKTGLGSGLMGIVVWGTVHLTHLQGSADPVQSVGGLIAAIVTGLIFYGAFAHWTGCPELHSVRTIFQRRKRIP